MNFNSKVLIRVRPTDFMLNPSPGLLQSSLPTFAKTTAVKFLIAELQQ